jgi:hypothetical protein
MLNPLPAQKVELAELEEVRRDVLEHLRGQGVAQEGISVPVADGADAPDMVDNSLLRK